MSDGTPGEEVDLSFWCGDSGEECQTKKGAKKFTTTRCEYMKSMLYMLEDPSVHSVVVIGSYNRHK